MYKCAYIQWQAIQTNADAELDCSNSCYQSLPCSSLHSQNLSSWESLSAASGAHRWMRAWQYYLSAAAPGRREVWYACPWTHVHSHSLAAVVAQYAPWTLGIACLWYNAYWNSVLWVKGTYADLCVAGSTWPGGHGQRTIELWTAISSWKSYGQCGMETYFLWYTPWFTVTSWWCCKSRYLLQGPLFPPIRDGLTMKSEVAAIAMSMGEGTRAGMMWPDIDHWDRIMCTHIAALPSIRESESQPFEFICNQV